MFNSRDLLGSLLQTGVGGGGRPTSRRVEHAIGRDGSGGSLGRMLQDMASGRGGGLGSILGGGGAAGRPSAGGGGLGGLGDLLRGAGAGGGLGGLGAMLGGGDGGGSAAGGREFGRNPAAMGGLGALAGAILGGQKGNTMRGAVGGAGLAVLGAMALDALARREERGTTTGGGGTAAAVPTRQPDPEAAIPSDEAGQERLANLLMRAMLSAAKADGHIDGKEMERILGKLEEQGTDPAARDFVLAEMRRPPDVQGLAAEARTPEVAAQVYAASLLAIEVDTQAERDYLKRLADVLGLDAATVGRLHESLGASAAGDAPGR